MTVLCAKRSKKDFKVYAVVRDQILPKQYLYGIWCLTDKVDEINKSKNILPLKYSKLSYVRKRFRAIN